MYSPKITLTSHALRSTLILALSLLAMGVFIAPAQSQVHEAKEGGYLMRANVASTQDLPPGTLASHQLRAADLLVNVVVLKQDEGLLGVAAEVTVETTDLIGTRSRIDMRTIAVNEGISYLGTFNAPLNAHALDFHITARPGGSDTTIELRFRAKLPRPQ
jgi:hypothetical protein